jgi:hypothetical protein
MHELTAPHVVAMTLGLMDNLFGEPIHFILR